METGSVSASAEPIRGYAGWSNDDRASEHQVSDDMAGEDQVNGESVWTVSVHTEAGGALDVALNGEIDYTNAAGVTATLCDAVQAHRPSAVRVNLAEVTFLDSSGIAVLVKGMKAAREAGAEYRVEAPRPRVLDQLQLTGLTELFTVSEAAGSTLTQSDEGQAGAA